MERAVQSLEISKGVPDPVRTISSYLFLSVT